MNLALNRLALFLALLFPFLLPARASAQAVTGTVPLFLTGSAGGYPDYPSEFNSVPVGKTLVLPVAVSGTGPISYSVTSNNPALLPILKTGFPVMSIHVSFSGTTGSSSTIYSFSGGADGGSPFGGVILAGNGSLYGTTETDGSNGDGTIYELSTGGDLETILTFTGTNGANPYATLVQGAAGFWGTTAAGGASGMGTIFIVSTSGSLDSIYSFTGGNDGANPYDALSSGTVLTSSGTTGQESTSIFIGSAKNGGAHGDGSLFVITTTGAFTPLYSFTGGSDGANPVSSVIFGTDGNYYGTATAGGSGSGTVFRIALSSTSVLLSDTATPVITGSFTPLYSFTGGADGADPYSGVIQETDGNLYGATVNGGAGYGTVYRISTSGSLDTIYTFTGGSDGGHPYAPLVEGTDGFLYGTTESGGANSAGTVFQISTSGSLNTLFALDPASTGANPYAALSPGASVLYGAATTSGSNGHGTVFQVPLPNAGAFSGTMRFALLSDMAPVTVGYISGFAQSGYYNGHKFFRITNLAGSGEAPVDIAQGGSSTDTSAGTPGFAFDNELNPCLIFTGAGQLAMANGGINQNNFRGTNGSQFFITRSASRTLDFGYTIFGQLLTGFDVMQNVMSVPVESDSSTPVESVIMDSVTVAPDDTDALILASSKGFFSAGRLTVSAKDAYLNKAVSSSVSPSLSITLSTPVEDSVDDAPIVEPDPDVTLPLHQSAVLPVKTVDLEFDSLNVVVQGLASTGASITQSGNDAIVKPPASDPIGTAAVGLEIGQAYVSDNLGSTPSQTGVNVYLGTGKFTPMPGNYMALPGSPLVSSSAAVSGAIALDGTATTFGTFLYAIPSASAAGFTAAVNWGDGTLSSSTTGDLSVLQAGNIPGEFAVSSSSGHIYSNPGVYPIHVTVTATNGGVTTFQNTAVVSPGPIYPFGRTFAAPGGVANGLIATFSNVALGETAPSDFTATINWGDGTVSGSNGIVRGSNGLFQVYGAHKYACGTTYPVDVTVRSAQNLNQVGDAWSIAQVSGLPPRQPPFPQSHINGQVSNPGYNGREISEEVLLINSGNLPSGPVALKFYLSTSNTLSAGAIPLAIGKAATYNTISIPAGQAIEGSVSGIILPSNVVSAGKYVIMQVITADPIGNYMDYPRSFATPFPLIE